MHLRLGTRGSPLALWQAQTVSAQLMSADPGLQVDVVTITTTGDRIQGPLAAHGGKALFVKEIEEQLLAGQIDLAVHSCKDLPGFLPEGLQISAVLPREDARDAWISSHYASVMEVPAGEKVGTSSPRRMAQLKTLRPDLEIVAIRGNVGTRLEKVKCGEFAGTVLAVAGLKRLGLGDSIRAYMNITEMIPAVGQGVIAIEPRCPDAVNAWLDAAMTHRPTHDALTAERALLAAIGGDCYTPLAGYAEHQADRLFLRACLADSSGAHLVKTCAVGYLNEATSLGEAVAETLKSMLRA